MDRRTRLRRTGILCLHCLRNAAYYRAWTAASNERRRTQFWRTLNGNFVDTSVLEWCKLFGDLKAKHHWSKSITDHAAFETQLLARLRMSGTAFEAFRLEVRSYRDKFVAHLDEANDFTVPRVQVIIDSVRFLYDYLRAHEDDADAFHDAPALAGPRFQEHLREGRRAHAE